MFSKENKRFTALVILLGSVVISTIAALVAMARMGLSKDYLIITGFAGISIGQILQTLRAERQRVDTVDHLAAIETKAEEVRKNSDGNLETAIEAVKQAEHEPAPGQEAMPKNPDELRSMLTVFAKEICDKMDDDNRRKGGGS